MTLHQTLCMVALLSAGIMASWLRAPFQGLMYVIVVVEVVTDETSFAFATVFYFCAMLVHKLRSAAQSA